MSDRTLEQLRRDIAQEILFASNVSAKVRATLNSAALCNADRQTCKVGNLGDDLKVLGAELIEAGQRIFDLNCLAAQLEAERDHGPTMRAIRAVMEMTPELIGYAPNPANDRQREHA